MILFCKMLSNIFLGKLKALTRSHADVQETNIKLLEKNTWEPSEVHSDSRSVRTSCDLVSWVRPLNRITVLSRHVSIKAEVSTEWFKWFSTVTTLVKPMSMGVFVKGMVMVLTHLDTFTANRNSSPQSVFRHENGATTLRSELRCIWPLGNPWPLLV